MQCNKFAEMNLHQYRIHVVYAISPSQNWSPEGNGVHFMFGVVSRPIFSEESHGADHFLKKGAQHAHLGPFWARGWV